MDICWHLGMALKGICGGQCGNEVGPQDLLLPLVVTACIVLLLLQHSRVTTCDDTHRWMLEQMEVTGETM